MITTDTVPLWVPLQVWLNLETAELMVGVFGPYYKEFHFCDGRRFECLGNL